MKAQTFFVSITQKLSGLLLGMAVLLLGLGHTANAELIVKVDLSTTTGPKPGLSNWNYLMHNSTIGAGSVINANGSVVPGLSVSVNATGADNNPLTLNWPGFGNDPYYVPAAYDLIFANFTSGLGLLGTANEMNVSFSGLDTSKTYNARVYFLINEGLSNFDAAVSGQGGMVRNNDINRIQVYNQSYLDSRLIFTNIAPTTVGGNLTVSVGASQAVSLEAVVLEAYAVPEPSTYAMALAGLACGGYLLRRRRKRANALLLRICQGHGCAPSAAAPAAGCLSGSTRMCPPWSLAVVVSFAVGVFSMPAQAGIISATVTNYSSVPLVDNSFGSVALAMNFGGTTTTNNGITFTGYTVTGTPLTVTAATTPYTVEVSTISPRYLATAGSTGADQLFNTEIYSTERAYMSMTVSGLDPFETYQLQYLHGESRPEGTFGYDNGTITLTPSSGPAVTRQLSFGPGGDPYAIVTVAVTGVTSLQYDMPQANRGPSWSGLVISVPEPSTYCMALAGLAGGGYLVRRRRERTDFSSLTAPGGDDSSIGSSRS